MKPKHLITFVKAILVMVPITLLIILIKMDRILNGVEVGETARTQAEEIAERVDRSEEVGGGEFNRENVVEIGGRDVVAFAELTEYGSNWINALYPIPIDGRSGWCWSSGDASCLEVWGVGSERGQRIADAYRTGELPSNNVDELNRVLRPDAFDDSGSE